VFKYFMRRLTLQGGFDKKKPMWAIVSDVLTARTPVAVCAEVGRNRLKYAGLPLDVGGEVSSSGWGKAGEPTCACFTTCRRPIPRKPAHPASCRCAASSPST
jgi:hypothetical protein